MCCCYIWRISLISDGLLHIGETRSVPVRKSPPRYLSRRTIGVLPIFLSHERIIALRRFSGKEIHRAGLLISSEGSAYARLPLSPQNTPKTTLARLSPIDSRARIPCDFLQCFFFSSLCTKNFIGVEARTQIRDVVTHRVTGSRPGTNSRGTQGRLFTRQVQANGQN